MSKRGLIVAIERYDRAEGLGAALAGTNEAARSFHAWLTERKGVATEDIFCCADETVTFRTTGTTRAEIVAELRRLHETGKDRTEELFVFFSGHGFTFTNVAGRAPVDVLVASDFVRPQDSGDACIQLGELQEKLRFGMGPGHHYYFIDACRNPLSAADIDVPTLGKTFAGSYLGYPTWYTLYSTAPGARAEVRSGFADALTDALAGKGRAKGWQRGKLWVTFELLCSYVKSRLANQEIDSEKKGPGEGLICKIEPPPRSRVEVKVEGAEADDRFVLTVASGIGPGAEHEFSGGSYSLEVDPFDYYLTVSHPSATVRQVTPPAGDTPVDLYDAADVVFRKDEAARVTRSASPPPAPPAPAAPVPEAIPVAMSAPASVVAELTRLDTGDVAALHPGTEAQVKPGLYRVKLREHGSTLSTSTLKVDAASPVSLDLALPPLDGVRRAILDRVSEQDPASGLAFFSETLGGIANRDLGLWLSLLGGARLIAPPDVFSKLAGVPLRDFGDARPGDSPVYVLAAFNTPRGALRIALHDGARPDWEELRPVKGLEEIHEHLFPAGPGSHLLSFDAAELAPRTMVVHTLPNRATFVTITDTESGVLATHQHVLPIHSLRDRLEAAVQRRLPDPSLRVVRTMYVAQEQFARRREIASRMRTDPGDSSYWESLTFAKWLDPLMSLIAAHELLRTADGPAGMERARGMLKTMVANLRRYFPGIADTEALARMAGLPSEPVRGLPILTDSLLALQGAAEEIDYPLPEHRLDFGSPWTSWSAAV